MPQRGLSLPGKTLESIDYIESRELNQKNSFHYPLLFCFIMRKKVDSRIRTLIENGVRLNQRSLVVLVGDKGRDQVVNLHYMLSKSRAKTRPNVLWCYKRELGFSSHQRKRMKQIKREVQRGLREANDEDPFELFLTCTDIRYTYYRDSHKILGQTFGCCILQDFEAVTPNLLARTIETVEGGGLIILLLNKMSSLKQLYSMSMDVHSRYSTEAHPVVVPRFNERFILSLSSCKRSIVVDDELNILPISSHIREITKIEGPAESDDIFQTPEQKALQELQESMKDVKPVGSLVSAARTIDQANAIMTFVDAISEKSLRSTVSMSSESLGILSAQITRGTPTRLLCSGTPLQQPVSPAGDVARLLAERYITRSWPQG